jgi:hypothetical protein
MYQSMYKENSKKMQLMCFRIEYRWSTFESQRAKHLDCRRTLMGFWPKLLTAGKAFVQNAARYRRISKDKTYSSRDSHVVTHRSTNLPFNCLCMAERTGCPVFS